MSFYGQPVAGTSLPLNAHRPVLSVLTPVAHSHAGTAERSLSSDLADEASVDHSRLAESNNARVSCLQPISASWQMDRDIDSVACQNFCQLQHHRQLDDIVVPTSHANDQLLSAQRFNMSAVMNIAASTRVSVAGESTGWRALPAGKLERSTRRRCSLSLVPAWRNPLTAPPSPLSPLVPDSPSCSQGQAHQRASPRGFREACRGCQVRRVLRWSL